MSPEAALIAREQDESRRLAALDRYGILDTEAEQGFDDIVLLAAQICETPVALVSLVASDRQWFKARIGFDPCETPLSQSVCALTLWRPGLLIIPDLAADPRTRDNTLVTESPHIRFYAGARLETPEGHSLGALCVIDTAPRPDGLTPSQASALEALARQVMAQMELRRSMKTLEIRVAEQVRERTRTWQITPDLMGVLNADGIFESSNPAWQEVLGWSEAKISSMQFQEFWHPDDLIRSRNAWYGTRAGTALVNFENRCRRSDGEYRWLSWVAVPEGDYIYCTARDVTAEREAQAQSVVYQEALRQSQKMEAVGQLTGGLAHDFNNLLTVITGSLELVERNIAKGRLGDTDRFLQTAHASAKRAASLTHRLLAFSRQQALDPKPTNVNQLVAGMQDLIRRTVGPAIALEIVGAAELWTTLIDPHQLESALLNLCINARDAMPDGGKLTVETANEWLGDRAARERDLMPGEYVSMAVSDTGVGMTPAVIARAFEPFFTTKPIGQGTGLGLSMIYGFARQSGGQARITSEPDIGTTVQIHIPRHPGESTYDGELAEVMPGRAEAGQTVLVVDDEPNIRLLVLEVLEELGYHAIEAGDGPAALEVIQSNARIDLLVTDVGLPGGMNGRQIADAGRAIRPDLRILFMTGYAETAAIGDGHLGPGMAVMAKPFALSALANGIKELIISG